MTDTLPRRAIGATGLEVSVLGFGTMAVGGQYPDVDAAAALATIAAARAAGITFFDAAPQYGCGLAEERLGAALCDVPATETVVSTKVGKAIVPLGGGGQPQRALYFPGGHDAEMKFDYSGDGTLRIVEGSLQRLQRCHIDMVLIHDVTRHFHGDDGIDAAYAAATTGALAALHRLRAEGVVRAIGIGLKDCDIAARFIEEGDIDVALIPGRLTLLDQTTATSGVLDLCLKHGVALIAAAPFDSGILATGPVPGARSSYQPASPEILARAADIARVAASHGVPLAAAALQYPLRHSAVAAVLAGMKTPAEVRQNIGLMQHDIPDALWRDLATDCGVVSLDAGSA